MRRGQVSPRGEGRNGRATRRRVALLLATVATFGLAACSNNRPAWERATISSPSSSAARAPAAGAAAAAAPAKPAAPGAGAPGTATAAKPSASAPGGPVERVALPPPGSSAAPAAGAAAAKGAPVAPSATTGAPAAGPVSPGGAPGRPVAAATALAPAAPAVAPAKAPSIDPAWIGFETHTARHEDTLIDLAVAHGLGFIEVAMANRSIDPWLPGEGTTVVLPNMHLPPDAPAEGLVLNLPEQRLFYYSAGRLVRSYPIGIGRDGHSTPTGTTSIVRKAANPTWYPTPSARADDPTLPAAVPPGPDNPLGNRAMYLGWTSYLIHGTNKDYGIGRRASRGCIRMYPSDIAALFEKTPVGTKVTAVDQPVKVGWVGGELYVEASPTIDQVRQWEEEGKFDPVDPGAAKQRALKAAGASADRIDWAVFDRAVSERRGIPTRITRPAAPALATASPPAGASAAASAAAPAARSIVPSVIAAKPGAPGTTVAKPAAAAPAGASAAGASAAGAQSDSEDLVQWLRGRLGDAGR